MSEEGGFSDFISSVAETLSGAADAVGAALEGAVDDALGFFTSYGDGLVTREPAPIVMEPQPTTSVMSYLTEPYRSY